jgi:hypothetical protein
VINFSWFSKKSALNSNFLGCREEPGIPILKSSARLLAKLNYICPDVFPVNGFFSAKNEGVTNEKVYVVFQGDNVFYQILLLQFAFKLVCQPGSMY